MGPTLGVAATLAIASAPALLQAAPGDILVTEFAAGSVVEVSAGGDLSDAPRFATGINNPISLCLGPGDEIYVATLDADGSLSEVLIITEGGDFTGATPFASTVGLLSSIVCTDTEILALEIASGRVIDMTAGGDFSDDPGVGFNLPTGGTLSRDSMDTLWVTNFNGGDIYDVTALGDQSGVMPFASGAHNAMNMADHMGMLYIVEGGVGPIVDFTAGGDLSMAVPFATVPLARGVLSRGANGLWAHGVDFESGTGAIWDISAGGDFTAVPPFAIGLDSGTVQASGMLEIPGPDGGDTGAGTTGGTTNATGTGGVTDTAGNTGDNTGGDTGDAGGESDSSGCSCTGTPDNLASAGIVLGLLGFRRRRVTR